MRRSLTLIAGLVAIVALQGCKNIESKIPGTWTSQAMTVTATADKKFTSQINILKIDGEWAVDGADVVFTPKTVNGKPVAEVKSMVQGRLGALPAQFKQFVDDIDKPNYLKLSDDGKTLTTDKEKDKNAGNAVTLTKQEA